MATEWYLCCEYFSWIAVCSRPTRLAFRWKLCSAPAHSLNSLALQHMLVVNTFAKRRISAHCGQVLLSHTASSQSIHMMWQLQERADVKPIELHGQYTAMLAACCSGQRCSWQSPVAGVVPQGGRPGRQGAHDGDAGGADVAREQHGGRRDERGQPLQRAVFGQRQLDDVSGQVLLLHSG